VATSSAGVAGNRAVRQGKNVRVVDAAATAPGAATEKVTKRGKAATTGSIAADSASVQGERALVVNPASVTPLSAAVSAISGGVPADSACAQGQSARIVNPAAAAARSTGRAVVRAPVSDGKIGDAYGDVGADLEDAAGVIAADGQNRGAGTDDRKIVRDGQFAAGQGDCAGDGKIDRVI